MGVSIVYKKTKLALKKATFLLKMADLKNCWNIVEKALRNKVNCPV